MQPEHSLQFRPTKYDQSRWILKLIAQAQCIVFRVQSCDVAGGFYFLQTHNLDWKAEASCAMQGTFQDSRWCLWIYLDWRLGVQNQGFAARREYPRGFARQGAGCLNPHQFAAIVLLLDWYWFPFCFVFLGRVLLYLYDYQCWHLESGCLITSRELTLKLRD